MSSDRTDIVERLRRYADQADGGCAVFYHEKLAAEAADEIERLREALDRLLQCVDWTPSPGGAVEQARATLSLQASNLHERNGLLSGTNDALFAENERLKEEMERLREAMLKSLKMTDKAIADIRTAALEEAARVAEKYENPARGEISIAAAIRALKDKPEKYVYTCEDWY